MTELAMRISVGLKIFAIAAFLLLLMIIVSVLSNDNVNRVRRDVNALADFYFPLDSLVGELNSHLLRQTARLDRLLAAESSKENDLWDIDTERSEFDAQGRRFDSELKQAETLAMTSPEHLNPTDADDVLGLAPALKSLEMEHEQFHALGLRIQDALSQGELSTARHLRALLEERQGLLLSRSMAIRDNLRALTERSAQHAEAEEQQAVYLNWTITAISILLGIIFSGIVTTNLVRPVKTLVGGVRQVEGGNLDVEIPVRTQDEIGELTRSFNLMVVGLRKRDQIKETFGKYLDPRIVESLLENPERMSMEGEKRIVTVLFSDIQGFTSISERLSPSAVVNFLNAYFNQMAQPIRKSNGIIDKFMGDAIMAFWGPPFTSPDDHAKLACHSALEQFEQLAEVQRRLPEILGSGDDLPSLNMRIGISTGEVVVGNIGAEFSKGYTVIGDTVNLGSRLESAGKQFGIRLLISEETRRLAGDAIEVRELDFIRVVGKQQPVRIFELLGRRGELPSTVMTARDIFEAGLRSYRAANWDQAQSQFQECLKLRPEDRPAQVFLGRIVELRGQSRLAGWDGVWTLDHK